MSDLSDKEVCLQKTMFAMLLSPLWWIHVHIGIVLNLKHVVLLEYLNDILVNVSVIRYADLEPMLQ